MQENWAALGAVEGWPTAWLVVAGQLEDAVAAVVAVAAAADVVVAAAGRIEPFEETMAYCILDGGLVCVTM